MKTNRPWKTILLTGMLTLLAAGTSFAQQMNYQGRLTDGVGLAVPDAQYSIVFNIFDAAAGGAPKWGPQTNPVDVVQGRFNTILGPIDSRGTNIVDAFDGGTRYLQITFQGNPILPRQQILAAPVAFRAIISETVTNGSIGTLQMADGSVTAAKMASGPGSIGQWTTAANSVDLYRPGGNVGVGTATPGSKLDVVGDIKASGNLTLSGTSSRVAINRTLSPGGATMIVRSAPGDTFLLYMEPGAGGLSFYVSRDGDVLAAGDISATGKLIANNKTAVVGEETLRIVRGIINLPTITTTASAGEKGTGYTVQKVTVAGLTPLGWRIRFDQPFSDTPSCTANIFGQFDWDNFISIVEATPDYVTLVSVDNGGTFFQDTDKISFIVVGPR